MIPHLENFYTKQKADEFFEFIKTQPFVRPPNLRNKTYKRQTPVFLLSSTMSRFSLMVRRRFFVFTIPTWDS
jgi:hypothetical protein